MGLSLRTRLVLAIGVPLLVVYALLLWLEFRAGKATAIANTKAYLAEWAAGHAAELDGDICTAQQVARSTANFITQHPQLTAREVDELLITALKDNHSIFGMCAAFEPHAFRPDVAAFCPYFCRDRKGGLRAIDIATARPDFAAADWYRLAKDARKPVWTEPYYDKAISNRLMTTYSAPFFRDKERREFRGLVTVDLLSEDLLREISDVRHGIKMGHGYFFLITRQGTFVSHPDEALVKNGASLSRIAQQRQSRDLAAASDAMVLGHSGVSRIGDDKHDVPRWLVYAPVPAARWSLAAVLPESEVLASVYQRLWQLLPLPAAGVLILAIILLVVSNHVTRPIANLSTAAQAIARGDLDTRVAETPGRDEMAQLARTFNMMVVDLKANIEARLSEEKKRLAVEGDLNAAREIQAALLPSVFPTAPDGAFSLYAVNAPAKRVAGDFFDFFFVDPQRLALLIADVSGKGLPAAVYMAVACTKLRDFTAPHKTPAQVITEVNRSLAAENEAGMFVTIFFAYYDLVTGELEYVNAGHNPPYVSRADGRFETLLSTGPIVAPLPDAVFDAARCRLDPGDMLVAYTDGVTESHAGDYEFFGDARLQDLVRHAADKTVTAVCDEVVDAVHDFSHGDFKDDVTLLALKRAAQDPS